MLATCGAKMASCCDAGDSHKLLTGSVCSAPVFLIRYYPHALVPTLLRPDALHIYARSRTSFWVLFNLRTMSGPWRFRAHCWRAWADAVRLC